MNRRTWDQDGVAYDAERRELRLHDGRMVGRCTSSVAYLFLGEVELWSTDELPALFAAALLTDERNGQPGMVRELAAMFCNNE